LQIAHPNDAVIDHRPDILYALVDAVRSFLPVARDLSGVENNVNRDAAGEMLAFPSQIAL
jgi:hypothetical protein